MTYIPNEEPYTDKYLRGEDERFFQGWDETVEEIDNITDIFLEEESTGLPTIDAIRSETIRSFAEYLKHELEGVRQTTLVSFVDSYTDEELKERGYEG